MLRVERIDAMPDNVLRLTFKDGSIAECVWLDKSRSESWTPEMREKVSQAVTRRYSW